jgi:hypothetical protein
LEIIATDYVVSGGERTECGRLTAAAFVGEIEKSPFMLRFAFRSPDHPIIGSPDSAGGEEALSRVKRQEASAVRN